MRERWRDLKQALREMFTTTWEHDDETDLEADAAARTEIVRKMRHPEEP